jgi:membrane fusion protein, multidrug efflux system
MLRATLLVAATGAIGVAVAANSGYLPLDPGAIRSRVFAATQAPAPRRKADEPVRVKVASVGTEDVPIYLTAIGTVQAYNTVNVKTRVDGEIVRILFREGQDVNEGDTLAVIDPRPYEAQLRQQEAMRAKDQAQLEGATLDLRRYESLQKTNAVSHQQVDQQRALVEQYRAQVQNDEAQIAYARTQVEYTTIRAPIGGRTGIRLVDKGNILHAADNVSIVVVAQLRPISVIFTLPADSVFQARMTMGDARPPVVAYAADDKTELDRGTIDLVDNQVDQTTGTIKLKASFPNRELRLWPGDFVNGRITVDTRRQGLTVPSAAVRHGPRGDFVWVVRADDTVESRPVGAGQAFNGRTLLTRGVKRGERVVTDGHFLLDNASPVQVIEPPQPPPPRVGSQSAPDPG